MHFSLPTVLAQTGPVIQCGGKGVLPGCNPSAPINPSNITNTLLGIGVNLFIGAIAFVAFGFLIKGGIDFIMSKGNQDKLKTAQKTMISALIGLVLAMSSYIIVQIVANIQFPS